MLGLLIANSTQVNGRDNHDDVPFHKAAWNNQNVGVLKFLLLKGGLVNARSMEHLKPLQVAAVYAKDVAAIDTLLVNEANVNARDNFVETPIHKMTKKSNPAVVQTLLNAELQEVAPDDTGRTTLHIATSRCGI